jgi:hypothetical protein
VRRGGDREVRRRPYAGADGVTYEFEAVATDAVGHEEAMVAFLHRFDDLPD